MRVDLDDFIGRSVFFFGDLDPKITWVCRAVLRPGDRVIDIGGNCGLVTIYAAGLVGPQGKVDVVEPQPNLAAMIEESAALNGYAQIVVHALALSDQDGRLALTVPPDNSGRASLSSLGENGCRSIEVEVRHAGRFLASTGAGPTRLCKIDVEGHEKQLLRGAADWFRANPPQVVLFEATESCPVRERPAVQAIAELGYEVFYLPRTKWRVRLRPLLDGVSPEGTPHDFVAVFPGPEAALIRQQLGIA